MLVVNVEPPRTDVDVKSYVLILLLKIYM
jgi:hypothetical protein